MQFRIAVLVALIVAVPAAAAAPDRLPSGSLVFAKGSAIWQSDTLGKAKPVKLVDLPGKARYVTRLELSKGARYLLIESRDTVSYATLEPGNVAVPSKLECGSEARLSPNGLCIACFDSAGQVIVYQLSSGKKRLIRGAWGDRLGFASSTRLLLADGNTIDSVSITRPSSRKTLTTHAPEGPMLVAPNGKRAVASYALAPGSKDRALYTFKLDGRGFKRKLGSDSVPKLWSGDSAWVLLQNGDAGCIVRAVGGQYKCWAGYEILSFGVEMKQVLLGKRLSKRKLKLFRASLGGPNPRPPKPMRITATATAIWVP